MVLDLEGKINLDLEDAPAQSKAKVAENQALEEAMEAMLALGYKATELKKIKKFLKERPIQRELYQVSP